MFSCVFGASPALVFCCVFGSSPGLYFLSSFVFLGLRGKVGDAPRAVKTNGISCLFEVGQCGSVARTRSSMTRKRPRNQASQGTEIDQLSLFFRARDASLTGSSKKYRLEVDVGSIFDPKTLPNGPTSRQGQVGQAFWSQKSRRSGRFVLFVSSVSSSGPSRGTSVQSSGRLRPPGS